MSKNDEVADLQGLSEGARPLIGGEPPSGPAGAGRVGVITRGGIVDAFRNKKNKSLTKSQNPPFAKPPYSIALGDRKGRYWGGGFWDHDNPTRPAPAGPDGGVRGGVAPPAKSEVFFGRGSMLYSI